MQFSYVALQCFHLVLHLIHLINVCFLVCAGIGIRETTGICEEIGILLTNPGRTVVGDKLLEPAATLTRLVKSGDNDNPKPHGSGLKKEIVCGYRMQFCVLWMVVMEVGMIVSTVFVGADDNETGSTCATT